MFRRNRNGTDSSIVYNGGNVPKHKSMLLLSGDARSRSVGSESDYRLPLNVSISAPTTPRNESGSYCKAISQVSLRLSQRRKAEELKKLTEEPLNEDEASTTTDEYYSAYYSEDDSSELGIIDDQVNKMGNKAKLLPYQNLPARRRPEELEDDDPLPEIPHITLPQIKNNRKDYHMTLSRKLELKHPCSPRLSESRIHLEETKKVIDLQKMLFELRVTFWQIENSREHAIKNYLSLASEAGYMICSNCKRLLRDQKLVQRKGNYHIKRRSRRHPNTIYYKCTSKTYDQHFITTPAGKFFPLSLEK